MYRLRFEHPSPEREPFVGRDPIVRIGRDSANELQSTADGVSDRHALIKRNPDGFYIRDLDSANGVRVNGEPTRYRRLSPGDELELGSLRLRFEMIHDVPPVRRIPDAFQVLSAAVVVALLAGQIAVFAWIFSLPHPDSTVTRRPDQPAAETAAPAPAAPLEPTAAPTETPAPKPPTPLAPTAAPPARPAVLNRMIRIVDVKRAVRPEGSVLTIMARGQVGERQLDAKAAGISVQFFVRGRTPDAMVARDPVWVNVAQWENFTTKTFSARLAAPPEQWRGFVVRTYYRGQLQDELADPPTLAALAPAP